jgi:hypothetical protein
LRQDAQHYAAEYGVDLEEALRRLQAMDEIGRLNAALTANEGDTFGGLWVEHEPAFRVVASFTRDGAQTIQPYIQGKSWAHLVEVREVKATTEELISAEILTRRALDQLDFEVISAVDTQGNRVAVWVTDPEWVASELRRKGIELPDLAELVVVEGERARGIDVCAPSPVPGVAFPRQSPVEGVRIVHDLALIGTLKLSDGCLRLVTDPGQKGRVLVWPAEFTLREQDGEIQVLSGRDQVLAREGEEICVNSGDGGIPDCVAAQLPASCRGDYMIVGQVRPNLRRDSRLFDLEVVTMAERPVPLLRKRPVLDEWAQEGTPLRGKLVLQGRYLEVQPAGDRGRYTPFWPSDYGARVKDGAFEIVDGAGQVVARVGQQVILPGGEIPRNWDSSRYRQLAGDLPCYCYGPYWIVGD